MEALLKIENIFNRLKSFGLLNDEEESLLPKLFLELEKKTPHESDYIKFVEMFNKVTGNKYFPDVESRQLFYEGHGYYTLDERIKAVKNALQNAWVKENPFYLTLKNFTRNETIAKYYNASSITTSNNESTGETTKDYRKISV